MSFHMLMLEGGSPWSLVGTAVAVTLLGLAAWIFEWAWWTPRRLERALRAQGLKGTRYRLFIGDVAENARINKVARTRPLPLGSHDIIPRVLPMFSNAIKENGKVSFTWFGPTPRVMIPDPELVREILSNKFGHYGKPKTSRIGKLLANGVVNHEGEKWAKHRRILNPAFHHEKIKRMLPVFASCCIEMITRWEKSVSPEGLSELDVWPEFQNLTGDVISKTAFGSNYQEGRKIFQLQGELAERLVQAFQTLFIPGYWYVLLFLYSGGRKYSFGLAQLHFLAFVKDPYVSPYEEFLSLVFVSSDITSPFQIARRLAGHFGLPKRLTLGNRDRSI